MFLRVLRGDNFLLIFSSFPVLRLIPCISLSRWKFAADNESIKTSDFAVGSGWAMHKHKDRIGEAVGNHRRLTLGLLAAAALVAVLGGCTRRFHRQFADRDVEAILAEKDRYPQWKIEQYHVYPDPRARFADPTNPDHPPMPPDDPAAWKLSPHPQHPGHAGVGWVEGDAYLEILHRWDEENRAKAAEEEKQAEGGAVPKRYVLTGESAISSEGEKLSPYVLKPFLLTLDQAVELGLINSREYQNFREELYEAALPVTLQRFSFAYQWAATEDAVRQWAGPLAPGGQQNNWNLSSGTSFSKLFSTGALLTFNFANTTVFNFLNFAHDTTSQSTIDLSFVQPLLQGGGRAVTLEPLTLAERNLLYSIRAFARFREQFYLSIALGTSLPGSLAAAAGAQTAIIGTPISTLAALNIASTDVSGPFRGYLPTLFRELDMAVDKKYVRDLEKALVLYEGFQEGGEVSPLQVAQVQSTLLNARNTVLNDLQFVTNALDQLKLQLGLPANTPLLLDDSPGRPITRQLDRYYQIAEEADTASKFVEQESELTPAQYRSFLLKVFTTDPLVQGTTFRKKIVTSWKTWAKETDKGLRDRQRSLAKLRQKLLDLKTDLEMKKQTLPAEQVRQLNEADFESDVGNLEEVLRRYESRPWEKLKEALRAQTRTYLFRVVARSAEIVLTWARNERREQVFQLWPELPGAPLEDLDLLTADVEQAQLVAVQAALRNRWDLMNAQAQVVDAWRQLAVAANALQGVFNLQYNLISQTPPSGLHAFAFSSAATNQTLALNVQLPLNRMIQRNNYRIALINYQVARRSLMSLEDNIATQVRFDVRQLHLFAENYKIQQKVLDSLYSQVESALEVLIAPPEPPAAGAATAPGAASTASGAANAAALTSQYLGALNGLNGAQTKMYDIWLSYLATRMQLYLDLELMSLNNRGVWTDEFATRAAQSRAAPGTSGPTQPGLGAPAEPLPPPRLLPPPQAAAME
jgi:hypothetical protein